MTNSEDYLQLLETDRTHAHEIEEYYWASPTDDIKILPQAFADNFKKGDLVQNDTVYINGFGEDV